VGKPDAGELVWVSSGVADDMGLVGIEFECEVVAANCADFIDASASGSLALFGGGGVSTNMIEGPGVSSEATAVRGVGFEVKFGSECSLNEGG
jgi:hypothetical protein